MDVRGAPVVLTVFVPPIRSLLRPGAALGCACVFYGFFSERKAPFYPPALLTWKVTQEKVPWGIVLLLGGGFALAKGCEVRPPPHRLLQAAGPLLHQRASQSCFVPPPPRGLYVVALCLSAPD